MGTYTQLSVEPVCYPLFQSTRSRLPEPLPGTDRGPRPQLRGNGSTSRPGRAGGAPAAPRGAGGSRRCCDRALGDTRVPLPAVGKERIGFTAVTAEQGGTDRR